ncbi:MAG: type I methionyl aminopeptidase [Candidatus Nealsonbacteria bacterium]|nr:type I methionyl aminopeptidase [Candidatus Nealsonbacteria bacterium]
MIAIKTSEEMKIMAEGGKILARVMGELEKKVRPGVTTKELDRLAESLIFKYGGKCSFKGYSGYPACLCTSINEEIVHAVPSDRILKNGDIISLDLGVFYKGYHSDMAITLAVGKISSEVKKLMEVTEKALEVGIKEVESGKRFGDISYAIQNYVESQGFSVVRDLCGHGIGRNLHEDPEILNYGKKGTGPKLAEGMVFCLEPMVTKGDWRIKKSQDGFGFSTQDGSLSAHFEYTLAIIQNRVKILTVL